MPIVRGSAPTYDITVPQKASEIEDVEVSFSQGDVQIVKGMDECVVTDNLVSVKLSQMETYRFYNGVRSVKIQIRVKPYYGDPVFSDIMVDRVVPSLFREEM